MAKYDATKFYWLQLKEDFFDDDAINWLEDQPNGKEYSLFYLKLCLKSLKSNGVLIRRVGNMLVPYDHVKLGELTKTNADTVLVAMQLLTKIGLVEVLENGELYLTELANMIGSQSKGAFKKQQQRLTNKETPKLPYEGQEGDKRPPKIEQDIEQEIEQDKELELEQEKEPNGSSQVENLFGMFWESYPKKINKKGSFNAFKKIKHIETEIDAILNAIELLKQTNAWKKDNGQYIPYPTTFINQERWKDDIEKPSNIDDPFDF